MVWYLMLWKKQFGSFYSYNLCAYEVGTGRLLKVYRNVTTDPQMALRILARLDDERPEPDKAMETISKMLRRL